MSDSRASAELSSAQPVHASDQPFHPTAGQIPKRIDSGDELLVRICRKSMGTADKLQQGKPRLRRPNECQDSGTLAS